MNFPEYKLLKNNLKLMFFVLFWFIFRKSSDDCIYKSEKPEKLATSPAHHAHVLSPKIRGKISNMAKT